MLGNLIYHFLEGIGYRHPLHPVMVHLPIGLTMAALLFALAARILRKPELNRTAYHALVLGCLFAFLALSMGLIDWQHFYNGALLQPIKMKLAIAFPYALVMLSGVLIGYLRGPQSNALLAVYLVGFLGVGSLGFFGGELMFSGREPAATNSLQEGQHLFESNCSSCHPSGENRIVPTKPIRSSQKLATLETFKTHVRNPALTGGSQSIMPAFSPKKLSDDDLTKIYQYVLLYLDQAECVAAAKPPGEAR